MRGQKLRVLAAEESFGGVVDLLRSLFPEPEESLRLTLVSTASVLLPTIQLVNPELMFLDLSLLGHGHAPTVRDVHRAAPQVPLITLAYSTEKEVAAKSLQDGATDFVLKDLVDARTLERVVRCALERNTVSGLADMLRDPATSLYNLEGFRALAAQRGQAAERVHGQVLFLRVAIENASELESEFGPTGRESAALDLGNLLNKCFRRTDLVARIYPSDFAVLAMDAAEPTVAIVRQRLLTRLDALNHLRAPWGTLQVKLTAAFWNAIEKQPFHEFLSPLLQTAESRIPQFAELHQSVRRR